jgi:hypothetical protein
VQGICCTALKKVCRKLGIERWPNTTTYADSTLACVTTNYSPSPNDPDVSPVTPVADGGSCPNVDSQVPSPCHGQPILCASEEQQAWPHPPSFPPQDVSVPAQTAWPEPLDGDFGRKENASQEPEPNFDFDPEAERLIRENLLSGLILMELDPFMVVRWLDSVRV